MKIEIDLPDSAVNKNIYIFANYELVARRIVPKSWELKTKPCSHCGKCCKSYQDKKNLLPTNENGCTNLELRKDGTWWCKARIPIFCLTSNTKLPCSVEWHEID